MWTLIEQVRQLTARYEGDLKEYRACPDTSAHSKLKILYSQLLAARMELAQAADIRRIGFF